jgi:hypothetical protein
LGKQEGAKAQGGRGSKRRNSVIEIAKNRALQGWIVGLLARMRPLNLHARTTPAFPLIPAGAQRRAGTQARMPFDMNLRAEATRFSTVKNTPHTHTALISDKPQV